MSVSVTVHRGTAEIGGSCIEIRSAAGQRLILDAGKPLDAPQDATDLLPPSLDRSADATVLICHPHQDHWGLINELPLCWPVMTGVASAKLIAITARLARQPLNRELGTWGSRGVFQVGGFRITPFLTDHSGFDAYMLLVEVDGRRILYSGDFRLHGRKSDLVQRMMQNPPRDLDMLILEGTNLGTQKPTITEAQLEDQFVELAKRTRGRLFVCWSGQNIDRTVTLYRAAKRSGRTLAIDLYTAEVLETVAEGTKLPRPGFDNLKVVLTAGLRRHYIQRGSEEFIDRMVGHGIGAAKLEGSNHIVMVRDGLVKDYRAKGVTPTASDAFSFSMWSGYLAKPSETLNWFRSADSHIKHLHTSGHASSADLRAFAKAMNAAMILPVHGSNWDIEQDGFERIVRLADAESYLLPD
ncbi:MBL fold metallo-hydrolase [Paracoccus nototheniae]|uniref:MBL fold metallo-hydrolase n=1 Tax=Paracoccus nototheniae TaxID=2489002 RepID=A0ABW4DSR7_9RHOB|nr:MBL fold metallo-hydrolase [Paracoccus nototheniae]